MPALIRRAPPALVLFALLAGFAPSARAACDPGSGFIGARTDYVTGPNPNGFALADFNHDGILDVAVTNSNREVGGPAAPGTLSILLGRGSGGIGDGTFDPAVNVPCGISPLGVTTAHLNGDGWVDLVVSGWGEDNLLVFLGQPGGTFANPVRYSAGTRPHQLVLVDFNADGILDIATSNNAAASVSVLLGQGADHIGDGTFGPRTALPLRVAALGIDAADVDGDGILDIVASQPADGSVGILRGNGSNGHGDGTFRSAIYRAAGPVPYEVSLRDLNADGHPDLVCVEGASAGVMVALGVGDSTLFSAPRVFGPVDNVGYLRVTDVDKDDVPDIVAVYTTANRLSVLLGHKVNGIGDGTFREASFASTGAFPTTVESADFNMDGRLDFVVGNYYSNSISVFRGTCVPPPPAFAISGVRDVPNDQGGRVFVTWLRHARDVTGGSIRNYRIWRRIVGPSPAASGGPTRATTRTSVVGTQTWYWEAVATLPVQRLPAYGYTAATTQDSLPSGNPFTAYFVTALTDTLDAFYDTAVDSGYSVDNLAPDAPTAFTAEPTGAGIQLQWHASSAIDLARYDVHRGAEPDFTPSAQNRVAATTSLAWLDAGGTGGWYKLRAVDVHENTSAIAAAGSGSLLGSERVTWPLAIRSFAPNPRDGRAISIRYTLPSGAPARLELFDVSGRRVWSQPAASVAGEHATSVNPRNLEAGTYLVRLTQSERSVRSRIVVLP